ncbi:MAG: hypothetical protein LBD23_05200 [Oscillospiraceae bacterium]|nr:hypothetical protein [Oscillospiraceae bacterium]
MVTYITNLITAIINIRSAMTSNNDISSHPFRESNPAAVLLTITIITPNISINKMEKPVLVWKNPRYCKKEKEKMISLVYKR